MNKYHIIAWLDDLQMSAHLAKVSTVHNYELQFCNTVTHISNIVEPTALVIDLNSTSEDDLRQLLALKQNHYITLMGYCQDLNGTLINYFKNIGYEMIFKRYDLMKNLGPILDKIFNAS